MTSLDEFNGHVNGLASFANNHDLPQNLVNHKVKEQRICDAKERGWTRSRAAASLDMTERRVRQSRQEFRKKNIQGKIEKHLLNPNGCAYLDQILELAPSGQVITFGEILEKLRLDPEKV